MILTQVATNTFRICPPATPAKTASDGYLAKRVAETLARRGDPSSLVIAIYGKSGEGKTTVLDYIEGELVGRRSIASVRFNPWRFADEGMLLRSFFDTLADVLKRSLTTGKERVGELLSQYGGLAAIASMDVQGVKVSAGQALADLGTSLSAVSLDEIKRRIEQILMEERKRVVILVDDIDRLDRREIHALFRLIKLTADFNYTSYVLAFDQDMVAEALGQAYGSGDLDAGQSFLEKIVQVPLNLPRADPDALRDYCLGHVDCALKAVRIELLPETERDFQLNFLLYLAPRLDTPRTAKRYANALAFSMPLLAGEVNQLDVMLLEGVKVFYPSLYSEIRRSPESFTGSRPPMILQDLDETSLELLAKTFSKLSIEERDDAQRLIEKLFPQVAELFRSKQFGHRNEEQWSREQRVASADYLRRYLTCSIPEGDIADQRIDEFLIDLGQLSGADADQRFRQILTPANVSTLISKMRGRVGQMEPDLAQRLARVVARCGTDIPEIHGDIPWLTPIAQAAILIRTLLQRLPDSAARLAQARDIVSIAVPLSFARECLGWMRPLRDELSEPPFSPEELQAVEAALVERIALQAGRGPLLPAFSQEYLFILHLWSKAAGPENVHAHMRQYLARDPNQAVALLKSQFVIAPFVGNDFQDKHYKDLSLVADPADVDRAILSIADTGQGGLAVAGTALTPWETTIIRQFRVIHERRPLNEG